MEGRQNKSDNSMSNSPIKFQIRSVQNQLPKLQQQLWTWNIHLQKVRNRLNCFGCDTNWMGSRCNTHNYIRKDIIYKYHGIKIITGLRNNKIASYHDKGGFFLTISFYIHALSYFKAYLRCKYSYLLDNIK